MISEILPSAAKHDINLINLNTAVQLTIWHLGVFPMSK